jgi:hypothetical protein
MGKKLKKPNLDPNVLEFKAVEITPRMMQVSPKITYHSWFQKKVKEGKLQTWQAKAVSIFFKKRGLGELETEGDFNEIFKIF